MKALLSVAIVAFLFSITTLASDLHSDRPIGINSPITSEVVGVGIVLEVDANKFVIREMVTGGPAERDVRIFMEIWL